MSILRSTLNRPTLFTPQVNVTGQFHNLTSSGTFPLPGTDTRSSGPSGAVQLSNGNGGFGNNGQLYVQNGLVLDNSMITDNTQKPFVLALASTQQSGYVPNPSVDKDGDIFYGSLSGFPKSFYGYKTGGWVDLAGAGGGGSGSSAPLNSIQFAGAGSVFQSSPLYGFYKSGDTTPSNYTLPANTNILAIGSVLGQAGNPPNPLLTTSLGFVSDLGANPVEFGVNTGGLSLTIPNGNDNQQFRIETNEVAPLNTNTPVEIQTRDGDINLQSRRDAGAVGVGTINLLTNTGAITLQSKGDINGTVPNTIIDPRIKLDSQDGDILIQSTTKTFQQYRGIELRSIGGFGNVTTDSGILLNSKQLNGNAFSSGKITLQTEGGNIELSTTTGTQGLSNSGFINLTADSGEINLTALNRTILLNTEGLGGSVKVRTRLEIQDTTPTTTVTIDGVSGNITTNGVPGNITTAIGNITATAGTVKGNQLESTTITEVGTDLIVQNDATIGNTGGGSFTVKTTNTAVGLPALRTYSAAGVDQTKLNTSLSLMADTSAVLDIQGANSRRLVAAGSLAYDTTVGLLTYGGLDPSGTLSNKFIGNKVLLKSTEFIQSLSKNNARQGASINYTGGTLGGYESAAASGTAAGRKSLDLNGNVVATMINDNQINPGGINDVFCVEVQMPPRYTATGVGFQNEFSVLVEGTVTIHYPNFSGGPDEYANIGVGVWATDAATPAGSANPAPLGGAAPGATDVWRWGNSLFNRVAGTNPNRISGGADTWPRPMHASYYYNLKESQVPPVNFSTGFGLTTPVDRNDDLKTLPNISAGEPGWIDPLGAPNSQNSPGQAGPPCAGSYFRAPLVSTNEYQITQVPFSIVCQNTNNTASVQKQYIWVTLYAPQGSTSTPFCPYVFRDGYYGFVNIGSNFSRYGGINTCSVYYIGDQDVMSDTTAA